jgi:phosphoribosylaminoimidazole (AIR) synthetase
VVVAAGDADRAVEILRESGETAWVIGELDEGERAVELS